MCTCFHATESPTKKQKTIIFTQICGDVLNSKGPKNNTDLHNALSSDTKLDCANPLLLCPEQETVSLFLSHTSDNLQDTTIKTHKARSSRLKLQKRSENNLSKLSTPCKNLPGALKLNAYSHQPRLDLLGQSSSLSSANSCFDTLCKTCVTTVDPCAHALSAHPVLSDADHTEAAGGDSTKTAQIDPPCPLGHPGAEPTSRPSPTSVTLYKTCSRSFLMSF